MSGWYFIADGQTHGPVSKDKILAHLDSGDPAQIHVWREGFQAWRLAKDVHEWGGEAEQEPAGAAVVSAQPAPSVQPLRSRKFRWSRAGAIVGLGLGILLLFARTEPLDAIFIIGFLLGNVVPFAFLGFVAGAIADLINPPGHTTARPPSSPALIEQSQSGGGFLAKHWRGALPLWVSYWVVNVAATGVAIAMLLSLVAILGVQNEYYPFRVFFIITGLWACFVALVSWQLTGTWRSAKNYKLLRSAQGRSGFWGWVAQTMVLLGALSNFAVFLKDASPQIWTVWQIAFQDDPDIPDYSIRVMRNGTEAEISGGVKFGLSEDFMKILDASPNIKVVHLNSVGGRVGEGKRLYELIRSRRLNTYVSYQCLSACTMAFAGGQERLLRTGAVLGFHKGAFPGMKENEQDVLQREVFIKAGFDKSFVDKALATPNSQMFKPEPPLLLSSRVITGVTDNNRFAISGFGNGTSKDQTTAALIKSAPLYAALKEKSPPTFDLLAQEYHQSVIKGQTEAQTQSNLRSKLVPVVRKMMPLADDNVLIEYGKLASAQYAVLGKKSARICYEYASSGASLEALSVLASELLLREAGVYERVLQTAAPRTPPAPKTVDQLWAKAGSRLKVHNVREADKALISSSSVRQADHGRYCAVAAAMFRELAAMPPEEGALLLRTLIK